MTFQWSTYFVGENRRIVEALLEIKPVSPGTLDGLRWRSIQDRASSILFAWFARDVSLEPLLVEDALAALSEHSFDGSDGSVKATSFFLQCRSLEWLIETGARQGTERERAQRVELARMAVAANEGWVASRLELVTALAEIGDLNAAREAAKQLASSQFEPDGRESFDAKVENYFSGNWGWTASRATRTLEWLDGRA